LSLPVPFSRAIRDTLDELLTADERVMVIGEAVGVLGGVSGTTEGLLATHGASRVVDTPLSEAGLVGVAAGLGMGGRIPVIELPSAGRVFGALEQLLAEAGTLASRTGGEFSAPMVLRLPCGPAGDLQEASVVGLLLSAPGITVASASSPADAAGLLRAAVRHRGPLVLLEPLALYASRGPVTDALVPIGQARTARTGDSVTALAWGADVAAALDAAEQAAEQGHEVEVIDLRTLAPLDVRAVAESVRRTGRVLLVEGESPDRAAADRILRAATEAAFLYLEAPPALVSGGTAEVAAAMAASATY